MGLRLLVFPQFGLGISGYAPWEVSKYFTQACGLLKEKVWIDIVMPKPGKVWKYDPEEFVREFDNCPVEVKFAEMFTSGIDGCAILSSDLHALFNTVKGQQPFYDAVINHAPMLNPLIHKALKPKFARFSPSTLLVAVPPFVRTLNRQRMASIGYSGEDEVIADLIGCLSDCAIVYNSSELAFLMEVARKYLNPAMISRLKQNTFVEFFGGVDFTKLDEIWLRRQEKKIEQPCLFWGGRFVEQKRWNTWLELIKLIHKMRPNVKMIATTQEELGQEETKTLKSEYPWVDFRTQVGKTDFLEALYEGDVWMGLSPISATTYLEQLGAGQIAVFIDSPYVKDQVPPDYPLVAKSDQDVAKMATMVLSNLDKWHETADKARLWVREKYERCGVVQRTLNWIQKKVEEKRKKNLSGAHGSIGSLVANSCRTFDRPFTFQEAMKVCTESSDADRAWGKRGDFISRAYLRQLILENGFEDLCDGPEPRFAPVEE